MRVVLLTKCLIFLSFTGTYAYEPRKRNQDHPYVFDAMVQLNKNEDDVSCSSKTCFKRSNDDLGPFWANRVRREDRNFKVGEPFYVTRGKKDILELMDGDYAWKLVPNPKGKRNPDDDESPFFAARGRKRQD